MTCWLDELLGIRLVRRSVGALAFVEVPEGARDLRMFDRNAVVRLGVTLQSAVRWALPDADLQVDDEIGTPPLRGQCDAGGAGQHPTIAGDGVWHRFRRVRVAGPALPN